MYLNIKYKDNPYRTYSLGKQHVSKIRFLGNDGVIYTFDDIIQHHSWSEVSMDGEPVPEKCNVRFFPTYVVKVLSIVLFNFYTEQEEPIDPNEIESCTLVEA